MQQSKDHLLAFLQGHYLAGLATVSPAGQPHATAIYYFVRPDLELCFITKNNTRKCAFLRNNGLAGLEIVDEFARQTVQVEGLAREIVDPFEFGRAVDDFQIELKHRPEVWSDLPISHVKDGFCIFSLRPSW